MGCEDVLVVVGDHVPRVDFDGACGRDELQQLVHGFRGHDVGLAAPHQQGRHRDVVRGVVEPGGGGVGVGGELPANAQELRIPVPVPLSVGALPDVLLQPLQAGGPWAAGGCRRAPRRRPPAARRTRSARWTGTPGPSSLPPAGSGRQDLVDDTRFARNPWQCLADAIVGNGYSGNPVAWNGHRGNLP